jgi:hypothetical protein
MIKVQVDGKRLQGLGKQAGVRALRAAGVRAINLTMAEVRKVAIKNVSAASGVKPSILSKGIRVTMRARQTSTASILRMLTQGISLIHFDPQIREIQTRRGLRLGVSISIAGKRELVPGGFVATMRSGHEGIFKRKGGPRLPIKEQFTVKFAELFGSSENMTAMHQHARNTYQRHFEEQLKMEIEKADLVGK